MKRAQRKATFVALVLTALLQAQGASAGGASAGSERLCSKELVSAFRAPDATYFTSVATADTLRAGAGPVASALPPAQRDSVRTGNVRLFGQVVRIEQVGGAGAEAVRRASERGVQQALLVPWGYRADCRPVLWSKPAQWMKPGAQGFFRTASLRPREDWVQGLPTFDVLNAYHEPYPHAGFTRSGLLYRTGVMQRLRDSVRAALPDSARRRLRATERALDAVRAKLDSAQAAFLDAMADTIAAPHPDSLPAASTPDSVWLAAAEVWFPAEQKARQRARRAHPRDTVRQNALRDSLTRLKTPLHTRVRQAAAQATLPTDSLLSAEKYFSLYEALPPYAPPPREAAYPLAPLRRWEAAHPELATRYPASHILREAYEREQQQ